MTDTETPFQRQVNELLRAWQLLGVKPSSSEKEINDAFRDVSKKYHPDTYAQQGLDEATRVKYEAFFKTLNGYKDLALKAKLPNNAASSVVRKAVETYQKAAEKVRLDQKKTALVVVKPGDREKVLQDIIDERNRLQAEIERLKLENAGLRSTAAQPAQDKNTNPANGVGPIHITINNQTGDDQNRQAPSPPPQVPPQPVAAALPPAAPAAAAAAEPPPKKSHTLRNFAIAAALVCAGVGAYLLWPHSNNSAGDNISNGPNGTSGVIGNYAIPPDMHIAASDQTIARNNEADLLLHAEQSPVQSGSAVMVKQVFYREGPNLDSNVTGISTQGDSVCVLSKADNNYLRIFFWRNGAAVYSYVPAGAVGVDSQVAARPQPQVDSCNAAAARATAAPGG